MYDIGKYQEATTVEEALRYLHDDPGSRIIAGGTDILINVREGKDMGVHLVGIQRINPLRKIIVNREGTLSIGPLVTFTELEENELINKYVSYLGQAGGTMGGPQLRNIATIGGNICNGATSADSASMLFCLNARLHLRTKESERTIPIQDFYLGPGKVDLKSGEMLTEILIDRIDYQGFAGKYTKFSQRKALDIATIGCSLMLKIRKNIIEDLRLAYGVAAPTPVRCCNAEQYAVGKMVTLEVAKTIGMKALEDVSPRDSWRGSKAYREQLIQELAQRAVMELLDQGGKKDA